MSELSPIQRISIKGFKSIKSLEYFQLNQINVLIGSNGAGKSNFISFFQMLSEMMQRRLQYWTAKQGKADRIVSYGAKNTQLMHFNISNGLLNYSFSLEPTSEGDLVFYSESMFTNAPNLKIGGFSSGGGTRESILTGDSYDRDELEHQTYCKQTIANWMLYHFHDTSSTAGVKRIGATHDVAYLRPDASNLAAFLLHLRNKHPNHYRFIVNTIKTVVPFFDDFILESETLETQEQLINLKWRQVGSDYPLWPSQLSDGALRFICLATALLQPNLPSTIIIDEPELGLHPHALYLLASLIQSASTKCQIVLATQSVTLINQFSINDLIIVDRVEQASTFKRLSEEKFAEWLEDYTVGDLWQKNIFEGNPK